MPGNKGLTITPSSGNVFRDLGFPAEAAEHLVIRAGLLIQLWDKPNRRQPHFRPD